MVNEAPLEWDEERQEQENTGDNDGNDAPRQLLQCCLLCVCVCRHMHPAASASAAAPVAAPTASGFKRTGKLFARKKREDHQAKSEATHCLKWATFARMFFLGQKDGIDNDPFVLANFLGPVTDFFGCPGLAKDAASFFSELPIGRACEFGIFSHVATAAAIFGIENALQTHRVSAAVLCNLKRNNSPNDSRNDSTQKSLEEVVGDTLHLLGNVCVKLGTAGGPMFCLSEARDIAKHQPQDPVKWRTCGMKWGACTRRGTIPHWPWCVSKSV